MTPTTAFSVDLIDSTIALAACRAELAALAATHGAASSIVQHPDWVAFEIASRGGAAAAHVLVARDASGAARGYLPLLAATVHARVGIGKRHLTIYRGHGLRLLGTGAVASPADRAAVEQALATALATDKRFAAVSIQESPLPNGFAAALAAATNGFTPVATNLLDQLNWTLVPPPTLAEYLASLDGKRRKALNRRVRDMYKALGETAELRRFDTADAMPEYARLLADVYARSWHAASAPIQWQQAERVALFRRLAESQGVIGHLLMLGERPIAYVHGYRLAGRYLLDAIGYDDEFKSLGIGLTLVYLAIQDLLERFHGEVIDFGYGDNQYKRVLGNHSEPRGSLFLVRGVRARLCLGAVAPLRAGYRAARALAKSERVAKWLKRG